MTVWQTVHKLCTLVQWQSWNETGRTMCVSAVRTQVCCSSKRAEVHLTGRALHIYTRAHTHTRTHSPLRAWEPIHSGWHSSSCLCGSERECLGQACECACMSVRAWECTFHTCAGCGPDRGCKLLCKGSIECPFPRNTLGLLLLIRAVCTWCCRTVKCSAWKQRVCLNEFQTCMLLSNRSISYKTYLSHFFFCQHAVTSGVMLYGYYRRPKRLCSIVFITP